MTVEPTLVAHPLDPVFDERSRVLVLGTMPSPASRAAGFYYGHSQNRFWKVLGALFGEPEPCGAEARAAFALGHGIALWDVLASCAIVGASDASIADPVPNDLCRIARLAPIEAVFTTGSKASSLYRRCCAGMLPGVRHAALPSTSPANARMRLDDLVRAYRPLRDALDDPAADLSDAAAPAAGPPDGPVSPAPARRGAVRPGGGFKEE